MPFESLSHRHVYTIQNFPGMWVPLVHLYDPDLPFFPLHYFHVLREDFPPEKIPSSRDRAFGFIEESHHAGSALDVSIICNKDLGDPSNSIFRSRVEAEIKERLGFLNPLTLTDVSTAFPSQLNQCNKVLIQLWHRIVPRLGGVLPFGRFFDPIFGFGRTMASLRPPTGRKSEWIMSHYFSSRFGEKTNITGNLPQVDFFLLPTYEEFSHPSNSLSLFPKFAALCNAADEFNRSFCSVKNIGMGLSFSKFNPPFTGRLDTPKFHGCLNQLTSGAKESLIECFNAFDKGPDRTVTSLLMLNDMRYGRLLPKSLTSAQFGLIYDTLWGFRQSPKVINIYSQQCFGNPSALPIDTWIETFMKWPLGIYPAKGRGLRNIFTTVSCLGKIERLLWIAAQTRKVHSSLCDDALWCAKYDSTGTPRGANPLACNACLPSIRDACPAYTSIARRTISFNSPRGSRMFEIWTDRKNNTAPNQRFTLCRGSGTYGEVHDDFTPVDVPNAFAPFPRPGHQGQALTVEEFIRAY